MGAEDARLREAWDRTAHWTRWGTYLAERQWGTVREDYSPFGHSWESFSHDDARSRAYRWGEDGLLGWTDRQCRLCFALALWNQRDPFLKERLFGLTNPEGNHGEDVKEYYFYTDATPTYSYCRGVYKYPQAEFPYQQLVEENARRTKRDGEFELLDTGVFADDRYFDITADYAKAAPEDILIRLTVANRGPAAAVLHLLPSLWFRNTWSWGNHYEGRHGRPHIQRAGDGAVLTAAHSTLGRFWLRFGPDPSGEPPPLLFTENETNLQRLYGVPGPRYAKDAFDDYVVHGRRESVNPQPHGTKAAAHYVLDLPAGGAAEVRLRLVREDAAARAEPSLGADFDDTFARRIQEANEFYAARLPPALTADEQRVSRQAYAGLLWSNQFYHYSVKDWLSGDPAQPPPPPERLHGRNRDWQHFFAHDILSMPDKWEYPWFAAWDTAFHMLSYAMIDPHFAKQQLLLFLREWYMHPNGQIPAYEFNFADVNPPVHAWACWRVYKLSGPKGARDRDFLARAFQKLLINFTWWVNRKDIAGKHLFAGGFLGLDNIGVFDRSKPLPSGGHPEQADGTAWMAFYCGTMLSMALELADEDPVYEDVASKFFEHFVAIADAMNCLDGTGLWNEQDGFYYDHLHANGVAMPVRIRSMVGLIPLFAVEVIEDDDIQRMPGFRKRMNWFLENRQDLARHIAYMERDCAEGVCHGHRLLAIPSRERLIRVLRYLLDENEFLSPFGIRSLSRHHREHPFVFFAGGQEHRVAYMPAESDNRLFGGNSNWRGPIWFPVNYLLIEALERYHHFYGDDLRVECPVGSGQMLTLAEAAHEIAARLSRLFLSDAQGRRPFHGSSPVASDRHWRDLLWFHEYFDAETGRGCGASHQTGWTALVTRLLDKVGRSRR